MTQKFRLLAVLALSLALGAGAARAQEEPEEVSSPACPAYELVPAPHAAPTAAASQCPSCCQDCASCACSANCCAHGRPALSTQYVVTTKIVHANADGDCAELMSPKVTVFDGQTANFAVYGEQTAKESRNYSMEIRVASVEKGYRLNLSVVDRLDCHDGNSGEHTETDYARTNCNVTLGKMKRLVLKKDADGTDRAWAEVMVTAIAPEADAEDSPLDCVNEAIGDLIDTVADVATSLFGDDAEVEQAEFLTPAAAAPRDYPVPATAPCPACKQCVAVEAVKKPVRHMRIAASQGSKCVEFSVSDGDKGWKGTADRITLRDGNLVLEGHVHMASSDGSDEITFENVSLKAADLEIQIGD